MGDLPSLSLYRPLKPIDPRTLAGLAVPEREWLVHGWIPQREVITLYGDGGVGKTLLSQQLMTSAATQKPWCGLRVEHARSVALFCEDDEDELHRRQDAINRHFGVAWDDLGPMRWASGVGADNILVRFESDGTPVLTGRYVELRQWALDHKARLVVIDPAADTFGGNENDRGQVGQFLKTVLGNLAIEIGGTVVLCAHPSKTGLSSGNIDGGSTAWNNASRARITLARPKREEGEPDDTDERVLSKKKANYSSIGDEIKLRWQNGVIVPEQGYTSGFDRMNREDECMRHFITLLGRLVAAGVKPNPSKNATYYAPKAMAARPDRQGFTRSDFERAMHTLLAEGKIKGQDFGPPSRPDHRIVVVPDEPAID